MIPGFVFAAIAIIIVSLLSAKPDATITDTFEKAQKAYHDAL